MLNGLKTEGPLSQCWRWQDSQDCSSKAKISNWMPMSKISQTHTHTECFCYQHRSPCANIIKHQVQVPQSGVVLRNKQSKKQWNFFPQHAYIFQKWPVIPILKTSVCCISGSPWLGDVVKECRNKWDYDGKAYRSHHVLSMTKQGQWSSSAADPQTFCELNALPEFQEHRHWVATHHFSSVFLCLQWQKGSIKVSYV